MLVFANKSDLRHSAKADQVERGRGREDGERGIRRGEERGRGRRCSYDLFEPNTDIFL